MSAVLFFFYLNTVVFVEFPVGELDYRKGLRALVLSPVLVLKLSCMTLES